MSRTIIGINDPKATQAWAKRLMVEALKETMMDKWVFKGVLIIDSPPIPLAPREPLEQTE